MKAVRMTAVGGPDVLEYGDVPEPHISSPFEIKVRLQAAGINPVDTKVRSRGLISPGSLPAILGLDGAGTVVEVGSGVTRFQPGDAVWWCQGGLGGAPGTYAEYCLIHQDLAQPAPRSLPAAVAAAGPLVLLTAWEALFDRADLQPGQTLLVHAGAGGVGHVAIQLAKLGGARVITTVSEPAKAAFVRQLGADAVVYYRDQDLLAAVAEFTGGRGVDVALDTVGAEVFKASIPAVAHYGDLVTLLDPGPIDWQEARTRNLRISFELMLTPLIRDLPEAATHQGEILRRCAGWLDAGKLQLHVSRRFPLAQAAEAHRLIGAGHVQGKLVLTMD
jgi:NADPH2:quinone reductase